MIEVVALPGLPEIRPGDDLAALLAGHELHAGDVLAEMAKGMDNARIAQRLFISNDTVKTHVKAILRKLGARDRAHAVSLVLSSRGSASCTCGAHAVTAAPAPVEV